MTDITSLVSEQVLYPMAFGFSAFSLFTIWKKVSSRWDKWFPLLAKLTRWTLYALALGCAYLGLVTLIQDQEITTKLALIGFGVGTAPLINLVARQLRPTEKLRRGANVGTPATVNAMTKKLPGEEFREAFDIAQVRVPRGAEPYHFLVVGSTGTGKSVAITRLMDHLQARGDIALIVDSGGDFCSRYFTEGRDHILNPYDDRSVPWSPTSEMKGPWDAESLAKSMVPDGVGENKEWNSYAQTFVTAVLSKLAKNNDLSIKTLLYWVQAASMEELKPFLDGTPAAAQLVSDKTFGSIRTIATNYLSTYGYLTDSANPFSITDFIQQDNPGFLFLTYRDDQLDSLRNMMSCVLDVAARTVLSLPENKNRRVWLIIDEFASIGKVQSIEAFATKARKKGGCLLLGLQTVSQLQDRYGDKGAQTVLSCLSSWLVLRCSDPETAEYISKYIGDAEVSRLMKGESSSDSGGSDSLSEQIQTQRAVMPVELQSLENLQGYFKLAGNYPIATIKLKYAERREKATEPYAHRDFIAKPMLDLLAGRPTSSQGQGGAAKEAPAAGVDVEWGQSEANTAPETGETTAVARDKPTGKITIYKDPFHSGAEAFESVLQEIADTFNV